MIKLNEDNDDIEELWFQITEGLIEAACKSNSYCDLVFVRERLLKLENKYYDHRNLIARHVERLEKKLSKSRWSGPDRALTVISLGTLYPLVRKYHRSDREEYNQQRNDYVNRIAEIERKFLPRIRKMKKQLENKIIR